MHEQAFDPNNPSTTGPNDPNCTSCAFVSQTDPSFATRCPPDGQGGMNGYYAAVNDSINTRVSSIKKQERFGIFAGVPHVSVHSRASRRPASLTPRTSTTRPRAITSAIRTQECQLRENPLFSRIFRPADPSTQRSAQTDKLTTQTPDRPDLVYYAAIAGVPHELLCRPSPALQIALQPPIRETGPQKTARRTFTAADWTLIQGSQDPEHYDFRGADFHMVESTDPRRTTPRGPPRRMLRSCPPTSAINGDPINGREWTTGKKDLEFACIFGTARRWRGSRDCNDPKYKPRCDCQTTSRNSGTQLCSQNHAYAAGQR